MVGSFAGCCARAASGHAAAGQRYELAASHCPMSPVLLTKIAHLGTADCCIRPPGRNKMIAITPPIIFSKEVAQKQATPLTAPGPPHRQKSFLTKLPGWRLDENLKPKSPPYRGARFDALANHRPLELGKGAG